MDSPAVKGDIQERLQKARDFPDPQDSIAYLVGLKHYVRSTASIKKIERDLRYYTRRLETSYHQLQHQLQQARAQVQDLGKRVAFADLVRDGHKSENAAIVEQYFPIVISEAEKVCRCAGFIIQPQELYGAGTVGLLDAIGRYEARNGANFATYAATRIRGEIIDDLRKSMYLTRAPARTIKRIEAFIDLHRAEYNRTPNLQEIREALKITSNQQWRNTLNAMRFRNPTSLSSFVQDKGGQGDTSLSALIPDSRAKSPAEICEDEDLRQKLGQFIRRLPEQQRNFIFGYYYEQLTLKQVGKLLRVTESRACQIQSETLKNLRNMFLGRI